MVTPATIALAAFAFELTVDGDFGAATENRVKHMQKRSGLTADGVVGPQTWRKLLGT